MSVPRPFDTAGPRSTAFLRRLRRRAPLGPFIAAITVAISGAGAAVALRADPARGAHDGCQRPYSDASPWNTPVGAAPVHPRSAYHVAALTGTFSSDPTQYTYPVYAVSAATPREAVSVSGWFSNVTNDGRTLVNRGGGSVSLPIPPGAAAAAGSDAQIILIDHETGDEWGASHFRRSGGRYSAWNVYHYDTRWSGVPPRTSNGGAFANRGAGVPYLAGLIRPCEIASGRIDHALAFAYDSPTGRFIPPATKSDGASDDPRDLPEGARLQLDPSITPAQIRAWGCTGACATIARALQVYGMYVIDNSGRPKVMAEFEGTARWNGTITSKTVSRIPLSAFRYVAGPGPGGGASTPCTISGTPGPDVLVGTPGPDVICGGGGDDLIRGGGGHDRLIGGAGADGLIGGAGNDVLFGGSGRDWLGGGPGTDLLNGGTGIDNLSGGAGGDRLIAVDGGRDRLIGGLGVDSASIDQGVDRVNSVERITRR